MIGNSRFTVGSIAWRIYRHFRIRFLTLSGLGGLVVTSVCPCGNGKIDCVPSCHRTVRCVTLIERNAYASPRSPLALKKSGPCFCFKEDALNNRLWWREHPQSASPKRRMVPFLESNSFYDLLDQYLVQLQIHPSVYNLIETDPNVYIEYRGTVEASVISSRIVTVYSFHQDECGGPTTSILFQHHLAVPYDIVIDFVHQSIGEITKN